MTPMADRQSNVDLVKDSSVGGICWWENTRVRFQMCEPSGIERHSRVVHEPGRWCWCQLRICWGSAPEEWCQRTWEEAKYIQTLNTSTAIFWWCRVKRPPSVLGLWVCSCYLSGAWMILLSKLWCRLVAAERPRNSTVSEVMRHNVMPAAHRMMNTWRL